MPRAAIPEHGRVSDRARPPILSRRALNRATLARQLLLERASLPALSVIEHLGGLQAQAPDAPYVGLWTRLAGFTIGELSELVAGRQAVRASLMRVTIHLVSSADYLAWWPVFQAVLERGYRASPFQRNLAGLDLALVVEAAVGLLAERPRTRAELGSLLARQWPDRDPASLAMSIGHLVPTLQVPPRGIWGQPGAPTQALGERWLGRPVATDCAPGEVIRRYLGAFGPATAGDVRSWSRLTQLSAALERLRPDLVTFRDERGRELFDLPDAPRPPEDTPAPVRYLPEYDNVLLGHEDRTRLMDPDQRTPLYPGNGGRLGSVLLDGRFAGGWRSVRTSRGARLEVELLARAGPDDRRELVEEGLRLLAFTTGDDPANEVVLSTIGA
jgi:Winged helix DNA-binding domain